MKETYFIKKKNRELESHQIALIILRNAVKILLPPTSSLIILLLYYIIPIQYTFFVISLFLTKSGYSISGFCFRG